MRAARHGDEQAVAGLLKRGVSVDIRDESDWTPLLWAAARGNVATVELLVAAGADLKAATRKERQTALTLAARWNRAEVVAALIRRGASVQQRDSIGWTPLMWAALKGRSEIVSVLLDGGAWIETFDSDGNTPLILAARQGRVGTVGLLLARGANVRARNREGGTAESLAREAGYPELADRLRPR